MASRNNKSKYWLSSIHDGLGLLSADLADQDFPPHVHDSLVVAVTEQGGAWVKGRGDKFMAETDATLVFNPDESHSAGKGGKTHWKYRAFYFRFPALRQVRDDLQASGCPYFKDNAIRDREVTASFLDLHLLLETNGDSFAIEERFAQAMGLLYSRHGEARPQLPPDAKNRSIVATILALLEDRQSEPLHLSELADEVGLTHFQLIGLFKNATGMTPYSMLTQMRLRRACRLLAAGMDICEVALNAGFYDQSALTNHFKRRFAVTPAQFVRGRTVMIGRSI